jgi:hypothetical protein
MAEPVKTKKKFAWQPFTLEGLRAFAFASAGWLVLAQLVVSLLAGVVTAWVVSRCWVPPIEQAIVRLPESASISRGQLNGPLGPSLLAENRCLSVAVDLTHSGDARTGAHVQIEFGRHDLQIHSLLGFTTVPYSPDWRFAFNRSEVEPWWGAWKPQLLGIIGGAVAVTVLLGWWVLQLVYLAPLWLAAFFGNRQLTVMQSWRLAGAGLLPGALGLTAAISGYGQGMVNLLQLLLAFILHFVVGWVYLALSLLALPRHPAHKPAKANPFVAPAIPVPDRSEAAK